MTPLVLYCTVRSRVLPTFANLHFYSISSSSLLSALPPADFIRTHSVPTTSIRLACGGHTRGTHTQRNRRIPRPLNPENHLLELFCFFSTNSHTHVPIRPCAASCGLHFAYLLQRTFVRCIGVPVLSASSSSFCLLHPIVRTTAVNRALWQTPANFPK